MEEGATQISVSWCSLADSGLRSSAPLMSSGKAEVNPTLLATTYWCMTKTTLDHPLSSHHQPCPARHHHEETATAPALREGTGTAPARPAAIGTMATAVPRGHGRRGARRSCRSTRRAARPTDNPRRPAPSPRLEKRRRRRSALSAVSVARFRDDSVERASRV